MPFLTVWIVTNCGKFLKRWEYQTTLFASWEICTQVKKQELQLDMEQPTGSKLGKKYNTAVHCHPPDLTYMQSTPWYRPGWMNHKLKSRFPPPNLSTPSPLSVSPLDTVSLFSNLWAIQVHILLKPSLKDFEHHLASIWNEHRCSLNILWHGPSLRLEWKLTLYTPAFHCLIFQICWHIECGTLTASSFRILNSSAGIPSPPLALFIVMLLKAHLTSHCRMSGSRWVITLHHHGYPGH